MSLRSLGPQPTKGCPVSAAWCRLNVPRSCVCPGIGPGAASCWAVCHQVCYQAPEPACGIAENARKALLARRDGWTYNGRTQCEEVSIPTTEVRRRSRRLELRTTPDERVLIDRAAAVAEVDLTEFVVGNAVEAARRVLADRDLFQLDEDALEAWEAINARPAADLPGLRRLMERPSPFGE